MESKNLLHCKICNRNCIGLRGLSSHIAKVHNDITIKTYYDNYIKKDHEGICLQCGKTTTFRGMNGYAKCCDLKCSNSSKEHIEKQLQTNQIRYNGVGYQSDLLREKNRETLRKNLGVDHPWKLREKIKQTWLKNLGVDNPSKSQFVKNKKEKTSIKNRGKKNYLQTEDGKQKHKNTLKTKYGVDFIGQIPEVRRKFREFHLKRMEKQIFHGEPVQPCIGKSEHLCLNELENYIPYKINRNPRIIGYFPDGYIKDLNLLIEYDERGHYTDEWKTLRRRDIIRENDLKQELNCRFFRIKDCDWKNNKQFVINQFKNACEAI